MYKKGDKVIFKVGEESFEYKDGDPIVFKLPNIKYNYHVSQSCFSGRWFLTNNCGSNSRIFDALDIKDEMQFCEDISGCKVSSGDFPEICCSDSTGISKVINKLMEMCEEKMKKSLKTEEKVSTETTPPKPIFKEDDYVIVISKENIKKPTDSETKVVLKESTPKYKLKFTN